MFCYITAAYGGYREHRGLILRPGFSRDSVNVNPSCAVKLRHVTYVVGSYLIPGRCCYFSDEVEICIPIYV